MAGTYQTVCYDLHIQFSGTEFSDRYQTDEEFKVKTHVAWVGAVRLASISFRFEILDRSF